MTRLNFPTTPTVGQSHTVANRTWTWDGLAWTLDGSASDPKSAYDLAVENGFVGTLQDWLDSLKGTLDQTTIDNIAQSIIDSVSDTTGIDYDAILSAQEAVAADRTHVDLIFAQAQDIINDARDDGLEDLETNKNTQLALIQAASNDAQEALDGVLTTATGTIATAVTDAQNAANAAVTGGQTATAKATEAGQSATAAQGYATAANTSASGASASQASAQTYAGQAASSASTATGSASTATTQAGLATTAATQAGNSASAASTDATTASTAATNAGSYATTAQNASITASTKATEASNSADSAFDSATSASSNSTDAAQQASAAASSRLSATIIAAQLFPSTFEQAGQFWTNAINGQSPANTTVGTFINDVSEGFVYQLGTTTDATFAPKGFLPIQPGRRYRITAKVRQSTAASDSSTNHVTIDLHGMDAAFASSTLLTTPVAATDVDGSGVNTASTDWSIIGLDFPISLTETAINARPVLNIGGNSHGGVVQVSYFKIQDTTESNAAGEAASAAVETLSEVTAKNTESSQYAAAALSQATSASTSASGASQSASDAYTSASQASASATTAAGSASTASSAATLAVSSKNDAGNSANAAANSASNASSSADDAQISAAAAQSYLVQAQLGSDSAYPSTFANEDDDYVTSGAATATYESVDGATVLQFVDGVGTVHHKLARPLVANRRYRMTVEVRALQDTTITSSLVISRLDTQTETGQGDYTTGLSTGLSSQFQTHTLLASESWVAFARDYEYVTGDKSYIRSYFTASGASGKTIQIRLMAVNDITESYNSGRSAIAAASSAADAAVSQTEAAQAATSAQSSETAAEVASDAATASAAAAGTSQTAASTAAQTATDAASAAGISAGLAAASATAAGGSALAAATSATSASTSSTNAGNSATAANNSSLNAASSFASAQNVANRLIPNRPSNKNDFYTDYSTTYANPDLVIPVSGGTIVNVTAEGDVFQGTGTSYTLATRGWINIAADRTYRSQIRARISTDNGSPQLVSGFMFYDAAGVYLAASSTTDDVTWTNADGWQTYNHTITTTDILAAQPSAAFVRSFFRTAGSGTPTWRLAILGIIDVTETTAAQVAAAAAATSASTASTSATQAGNFATTATNASNAATSQANAASGSATVAGNAATSAGSYATQAQNSADAASGSASSASTQATAAGQSASSAQGFATSASTNATAAQGYSSSAQTYSGNAQTYANQASASASTASGAANTATTQAGIASTSAATAGTAATTATNAATAAQGSATTATNQATAAQGSASTATTQATAAGNSATTASTAATTAQSAYTNVLNQAASIFPDRFDATGTTFFAPASKALAAGNPSTLTMATGDQSKIITESGYGLVYNYSTSANLATKGAVPAVTGRVYEISYELSVPTYGGSAVIVRITMESMNSSYADIGGALAGPPNITATGVVTGSVRFSDTASTGISAWSASSVWLRPVLTLTVGTSTVYVRRFTIKDITSQVVAEQQASAASTSATAAGTSATLAGTQASAAQSSATSAATQAGNASTSASQASNSASTATTASNTATAAQGVASTSATNAQAALATAINQVATIFPERLDQNGTYFYRGTANDTTANGYAGSPTTKSLSPTDASTYVVNQNGYGYVWNATLNNALLPVGVIATSSTKVIEVTIDYQVVSASSSQTLSFGMTNMDASYGFISNSAGNSIISSIATSGSSIIRWSVSGSTSNGTNRAWASNAIYIRPYAVLSAGSGAVVYIKKVTINDITSVASAENQVLTAQIAANSAVNSSITATTQAGLATSSATAAQGSAATASTQAGNASSSATQAANSASSALGYSNSASSSQTVAVNSANSAQGVANRLIPSRPAVRTDFVADVSWAASPDNVTSYSTGTVVTVASEGDVLQDNVSRQFATRGGLPVGVGKTFQIDSRSAIVSGGTSYLRSTYFRVFSSTWADLGAYQPIGNSTSSTSTSYLQITVQATSTQILAAYPSAAYIRAVWSITNGTSPTWQVSSLQLSDVTAMAAAVSAASAAATSATNASTSESQAGTSAGVATAQATIATTQAGTAQTYANQASNSSTTASGSSNTATTQAGVASSAAIVALQTTASQMPYSFTQDGRFWLQGFTGDPTTVTSITAGSTFSFPTVSGVGKVMQIVTTTSNVDMSSVGVISVQAGRRYRISALAKLNATAVGSPTAMLWGIYLNSSYAYVSGGAVTSPTLNTSTWTAIQNDVLGDTILAAGGVYLRPMFRANTTSANTYQIQYLKIEDITSSYNADVAATAAATSASSATTQAGNAQTYANAAQTSATSASTQAGNAQTFANQASNSASTASGSSNTATSQAGVASAAATTATNQATAAQGSATTAQNAATTATNQATAASGSANTATTAATQAGNSATAANTSATNAASSFTNANLLISNIFPDKYDGTSGQYFTNSNTGSPASVADLPSNANASSYGPVYSATTNNAIFATRGVEAATNGRIYKVEVEFQMTSMTGTGSPTMTMGVACLDSAYSALPAVALGTNVTLNGSVQTMSGYISNVASSGVVAWTANSIWLRFTARVVWGTGPTAVTLQYRRLTIQDVTESYNSSQNATAAATSASAASTSATLSDSRATSATNSANTATTQAGLASGSASAASTSASQASASASTAGGYSTSAQGYATTASTQAGNAQTYANQASTSAGTATTGATNASSSAGVAASSALSAQSVANRLLPNRAAVVTDYVGGGATLPDTSAALNLTNTSIVNDSQEGSVLQIAAGQNLDIGQRGWLAVDTGQYFRHSFRARTVTGGQTLTTNMRISLYNAAGVQLVQYTVMSPILTSSWQEFTFETTSAIMLSQNSGAVYARAYIWNGSGTVTHQISKMGLQNTTSEKVAENSAAAAATSASTASTAATAAGNSATSATNSSTSASASFNATNVLTAYNFPDRYDGTTGSYFTTSLVGDPISVADAPSNATVGSYGPVYQATVATANSATSFATRGAMPAVANRIYKIEAEFQRTAITGSNASVQLVVRSMSSSFADLGTTFLSNVTTVTGSVQTVAAMVSNTSGADYLAWVANAVWLRPYLTVTSGAATTGLSVQIRRITVTDVTQSYSALQSANAAATSYSNAQAQATAAGNSASSAQGYATTASTQAGNAQSFANQASSSASTAQGYANTASTQAGVSTTASNASAASALVAQSVANGLIPDRLSNRNDFSESYNAAALPDNMTPLANGSIVAVANEGNVYQDNVSRVIITRGWLSVGVGKTFQIDSRSAIVSGGTGYNRRLSMMVYNSSYAYLGQMAIADSASTSTTFLAQTAQATSTQILSSYPTASYIRANFIISNGTLPTWQLSQLKLQDVTNVATANAAASAAAGSATSASSSATDAGNYASSAQGYMTNANTAAGNAQTYAGQASTSASNAQGFANTATTQAGLASGYASTSQGYRDQASSSASAAATSATNASNSASSASTSATLASNFSTGSIYLNSQFTNYTNGSTGVPADSWNASPQNITGVVRTTGENGVGFAMRIPAAGGTDCWLAQTKTGSLNPNGWYVLEFDFLLNSGTLVGSGILWRVNDTGNTTSSDMSITFSTDVNNNTKAALGNGTTGNVYRFRKLIQIPSNRGGAGANSVLFLMNHYSPLGSVASANDITWYRAGVRVASQGEIDSQTALALSNTNASNISTEAQTRADADTALATRATNLETSTGNLTSRVSTTEGAITSLNGKTTAYWTTTAVAGNGRAQLSIHADANGGGGVDITGNVAINGNLLVTGSVSTSNLALNSVTSFIAIANTNSYAGTGQGTTGGGGGGGGGDDGGGGGYGCVVPESIMPNGGIAGDLQIGDALTVLTADRESCEPSAVEDIGRIYQPCYRITTESGITLVASVSTPMTLRDGRVISIMHIGNHEVAVLDNGEFRWEPVTKLDYLGQREVVIITTFDGTYAAGEVEGRYVFTHNKVITDYQ